jgi:hypothetical protein
MTIWIVLLCLSCVAIGAIGMAALMGYAFKRFIDKEMGK